jgi:hypothetical protein
MTNQFKTYEACRMVAQAMANMRGQDSGIERNAQGWRCIGLPSPEKRCGFELKCEVVSPEPRR